MPWREHPEQRIRRNQNFFKKILVSSLNIGNLLNVCILSKRKVEGILAALAALETALLVCVSVHQFVPQ